MRYAREQKLERFRHEWGSVWLLILCLCPQTLRWIIKRNFNCYSCCVYWICSVLVICVSSILSFFLVFSLFNQLDLNQLHFFCSFFHSLFPQIFIHSRSFLNNTFFSTFTLLAIRLKRRHTILRSLFLARDTLLLYRITMCYFSASPINPGPKVRAMRLLLIIRR